MQEMRAICTFNSGCPKDTIGWLPRTSALLVQKENWVIRRPYPPMAEIRQSGVIASDVIVVGVVCSSQV